MNKFEKTLLSSFAGTTFMTASSALTSLLGQDFREPAHLTTMVERLAPFLSKKAKLIIGWAGHYGMGIVFAAVYVELWERGEVKHTMKNALILGTISGLVGLLIWKGTFKAHPLPPSMNYLTFYLQRIPAHIVFAVFATLAYQLIKDQEQKK
jgi:hypothetical protein